MFQSTCNICSALGIDEEDISNKVIGIKEDHGTDSSFILSRVMVQQLKMERSICLISLRNTFLHYNQICLRLGQNLKKIREDGFLVCVETLSQISDSLLVDGTGDHGDKNINFISDDKEFIVKSLYNVVKNEIQKCLQKRSAVCVLIDDISYLLMMGIPIKLIFCFLQYCRSLCELFPVSLVVVCHTSEDDDELLVLSSYLKHISNVNIYIESLKSGQFAEISGLLVVERPEWKQSNIFLYKLLDKEAKIYSPGLLHTS